MQAHINYLQQKLIANTNRIFAIGSDESLSRIKMSTYMQLHERCLIPSLLYNAETWTMSKDETRRLEQLQLRTLRTYLKAPRSVPKMAFYLELGLYPVEATIDITQIKYLWKLLNTTTQVRAILETQLHLDTSGSWADQILDKLINYGLPVNTRTIKHYTKKRWDDLVTKTVRRKHEHNIYNEATKSIKLTRILQHKKKPVMENYITLLNRKRASTIFRLRCKSTKSADNMNHATALPICPKCSQNLASDNHLFTECPGTESLRNKFNVYSLDPIYQQDVQLEVLERMADFAMHCNIVADTLTPPPAPTQ